MIVVLLIKVWTPVSVAKDKKVSGGEDAVLVGSHLCCCKVILLLRIRRSCLMFGWNCPIFGQDCLNIFGDMYTSGSGHTKPCFLGESYGLLKVINFDWLMAWNLARFSDIGQGLTPIMTMTMTTTRTMTTMTITGAPIRSRIWDLVPNGTKVLKRSQKSPYFASQVPNFSFISINERIASI